jgi:tRNA dimethylallyltransferase
LEFYKATGRPISHAQTQFDEGARRGACHVFAIEWTRQELHHRIDARVERMFSAGLVEEVQRLLNRYGQLGRTASQAVGYREVIEYLRGERDLEATAEAVKARTRQFARRQETWFRSLEECCRVRLGDRLPEELALEIIGMK